MQPLVFFDSNILIDHLRDKPQATALIAQHPGRAISAAAWMEVLAGDVGTSAEHSTRRVLSGFAKMEITPQVQERAVLIRRTHRLKLIDAIVYATAQEYNAILFTRDAKDFPDGDARIVVPYQL